jgi:hypothetical protein
MRVREVLRTVKLRVKVNYDVHSALEEVEREYRGLFWIS